MAAISSNPSPYLSLASLVQNDGSISLSLVAPDSLECPEMSALLTAEYENQLRAWEQQAEQGLRAAPRKALKVVTNVAIKNNVIYMTSNDEGLNNRFLPTALFDALKETLHPRDAERQREFIRAIIAATLAFPSHTRVTMSIPVNALWQGADLNAYFAGKFCKHEGSIHKILAIGYIPGSLVIQIEPIDSPSAQERRRAFELANIGLIIGAAAEKAGQNLKGMRLVHTEPGPEGVGTVMYFIPSQDFREESAELVKILQPTIRDNALEARCRALATKCEEKKA